MQGHITGGVYMKIIGTDISMVRGDSESLTVRAVDDTLVQLPFNAGDTVYLTIKENAGTAEKIIQKVVTVFTDGEAVIDIAPSDTSSMYFKPYVYDIQWNQSSGVVTTIVPISKFTILEEVTYE